MYRNTTGLILTGLLLLTVSCKTGQQNEQENVDKLLEQQAEIQERQEESLQDISRIKDSLEKEKSTLLTERELKGQQIQQLEENQASLADRLKGEEIEDVSAEKTAMEQRMEALGDSVEFLKMEVKGIDVALDSIQESLEIYSLQETRSEKSLESGIQEIDQRMTQREARKQQEIQRISLLEKRVAIAEKKIEAYELERQLYVDERDELLRKNAEDQEVAPYRERIAEMDRTIGGEKENLQDMKSQIRESEEFVAETDQIMQDLNEQIKAEYDKKAIIESFIASEKERLQRDLQALKETRSQLLTEQESVSGDLTEAEQTIRSLERDMELIRNKEMSEILEQQAQIESSEADLAEEEVSTLENVSEVPFPERTTGNEEMDALLAMSSELDSLNKLIQAEKAEIAKTRMELSERRAEAAAKRAQFGRTVSVVVIILIIAGIGLLGLFYYLGWRSRARRSAK